ncbi:MAG: radical SAM protein [Chitinivibrionales bacterium]|nr:radical SAM protein [Chitinivibrionales bacterium]
MIMDAQKKLEILSGASQYDLSCACGSNQSEHRKRGNDGTWLYPVSLPSGGTSVILKTLVSNVCVNDCKYCPYRSTTDVPRCTLSPDEAAKIFLDYHKRKGVFGLFLSSGVVGSPDNTMQHLNDTAKILRYKNKFKGYIHLKIIPGASDAAIDEALSLATTVSLNIEIPGDGFCRKLSSKKDFSRDIIRPMQRISNLTARGQKYAGVHKTTQFIVGAADENDGDIVKYLFGIYDKLHFNRVYFSAYQRGTGAPEIPGERNPNRNPDQIFMREHRLYQVDFLLRKYRFLHNDIFFGHDGNLMLEKDPKLVWAERNPHFYPVNLNKADKFTLLRVPGIGPTGAAGIIKQRIQTPLKRLDDLPFKGRRRRLVQQYIAFN